MLISKMIMIEFADPGIRAIDRIQDLREAAANAGLNLYSRYEVQLQYPMPTKDNRVVVEIRIPEEIVTTFMIGNHLRGFSTYLLSKYGGFYQQHTVGKRLLNYIEVGEEVKDAKDPGGLSMIERMEMIILLTRLLERSDPEALDMTSRIATILKEFKPVWEYDAK